MAKKKKVFVSLVLDETGSMNSCKEQTISAYNEYVESLLASPDASAIRFTLTKFNAATGPVIVVDSVKLADAPKLTGQTYVPDAMTPLYDALGSTVRALEGKVGKKDGVILAVLTDGYENCSREWSAKSIRELVKDKEDDGWTFAYLGSHADTFLSAADIGINRGNTMVFAANVPSAATQSLAGATLAYTSNTMRSSGARRKKDNLFDKDSAAA